MGRERRSGSGFRGVQESSEVKRDTCMGEETCGGELKAVGGDGCGRSAGGCTAEWNVMESTWVDQRGDVM